MFSATDIYRAASLQAQELDKRPVEPQVLAAVFNEKLRDLVLDVAGADEEALAAEYEIPAAVVAADPNDIDLTDDGSGAGAREWLQIGYVEWRDASDEGDEVCIGTIEARNRLDSEYGAEWLKALVHSGFTKMRKLGDWTGVDHLIVWGTLAPVAIDGSQIRAAIFNYPAAVRSALVWELVVGLAPYVGIRHNDPAYLIWTAERKAARDRLDLNTAMFLTSRAEGIPRVNSQR